MVAGRRDTQKACCVTIDHRVRVTKWVVVRERDATMSRFHLVAALMMVSVLSLCGGCRDTSSPLVGTWKSGRISTEWGDVKAIVVFTKDTMTMTFVPFEGEPISATAGYKVRDGTIVSDDINGGEPMAFSIKDNELVLIDRESRETRFVKRWW